MARIYKVLVAAIISMMFCHVASAQTTFTLGSTADEVKRVQGMPSDVSRYSALGYEVWRYGYSTVKISTRTKRVVEWSNQGNLKVQLRPGPNVTTASYFTRGSHKDDVLRLQGTPSDISRYPALGYEVWRYGYSTVKISTRDEKVIEWSDQGNLKVGMPPGKNVTMATSFTRGSHKDDVLRLQGTPSDISRYPALGYEVWRYGYSTVKIFTRTDRVIEWSNQGNLKVNLQPGHNVTTATFYGIGSHKDDVLRLQGTPSDVSRYPALGYEIWRYGYSTVKISLLTEKVTEYSNQGNLKVSATVAEAAEKPVKYHHKFGDVTLYYDDNKTYTGVFSFDDESLGTIYGIVKDGISYFYDANLQPLDVYAYVNESDEITVGTFEGSHDETWLSDFSSRLSFIDIFGDYSASGTVMQFDGMTFYDLISSDGTSVYGSSIDFDTFSFDDFYTSTGASYSGSRIHIGNFSFGDWWSTDGTSISGTSQRIGNIIFHDYTTSNGGTYTGTTMEIGDFSFTTINNW